MSGFFTWQAFAAFILGVLLSGIVRGLFSKVTGGGSSAG